jgi:hypothetical protein
VQLGTIVRCFGVALAAGATAAWGADDCANPTVITALPFQHAFDSATVSADPGDPPFSCHAGGVGPGARTAWYRFTAPHAMTIEVDTHDTENAGEISSAALAAFGGTCGALAQTACNDVDFDDYAPFGLSRVLVTLGAGETTLIEVLEDDAADGEVVVTVRESPIFRTHTSSPDDVLGWPVVAAQPGGGYLAVWRESSGAVARLYEATGAPQGAPFAVSTSQLQDSRLGVAADAAGNFVVSYSGPGGIFAQRIDAGGALAGAEIPVAAANDRWTNVGMDAAGNFVVVWPVGGDVMARLFDAGGTALGAAFPVDAASGADTPKVAMAPDGRFVVTWTDTSLGDGDGSGVFARRYDAAGAPVAARFLVNDTTASSQGYAGGPGISVSGDGSFVVVWDDASGACSTYDCVRARRFDANGNPLGGDFQVSEHVQSSYSYSPAVAHDPAGAFIVSWVDYDDGPMARRFDSTGSATGPQLRVGIDSYQFYGDVAAGDDGFMVVWDWEVVGSDTVVYGRRMPAAAPPVCTDVPRTGCRGGTVPLKGVLSIKDTDPDRGDRLAWKWVKGEATSLADFGEPLADDSYTLCLYEDGFLSTRASIAGATACGGVPCWKDLGGSGRRYVEKKALSDGAQKLVFKAGGDGAAKVIFKGKGTRLREEGGFGSGGLLPLAAPVAVQLVSSTGTCWESTYDAGITMNTASKFVARPD